MDSTFPNCFCREVAHNHYWISVADAMQALSLYHFCYSSWERSTWHLSVADSTFATKYFYSYNSIVKCLLHTVSLPLGRIENLYCFQYTASNEFFSREDGWKKFSLESEFKRMGCPNNAWSLITLNQNYKVITLYANLCLILTLLWILLCQLCETYPLSLYVPTMASVYTIQGSANFRSKSRLPVLTYLHSNKVWLLL